MPTELEAPDAALRLRRSFAGLLMLERASRAFEGLAIGASCAWVLIGLARIEGEAAASAALAPAVLAGMFATASWVIERWRAPREIARRADSTLATPQLLDTALEAPRSAQPAWSELLARRALARFDRTRLWLAAAPAWAATAAVVLCALGARAGLERWAPSATEPTSLTRAWSTLAEGLENGAGAPAVPASAAPARAELASELRAAAQREERGELGAEEARALLGRAAVELGSGSAGPGSDAGASLRELAGVYGSASAGPLAGAGGANTPASSAGSGSGVPSGGGDGTMGGSAEGGSTQLPAPPGSTGGGAAGVVRPTLSARWWPRDQDGLVEAWIERQQRTRSKR